MTSSDRLEPEVPLAGGNMTAGVVRVGNTVRRPAGPQTVTVHRLLAHVRAQGVDWVPRVHGIDSKGREILDYIEGEVAHGDPPWIRDDAVLDDVARALREWHDATASFDRRPEDVWWWPGKEPAQVICHVDFAPYNTVFRGGTFVGAIDFDLCYPAPRLWDLAWTAYRYCPLTPPPGADANDGEGADRSPFDLDTMLERAQRLLNTYGPYVHADGGAPRVATLAELLGWLVPRLDAIADWGEQQGVPEHLAWARMYRAHARWVEGGALGVVEHQVVRDLQP